MRLGGQIIMVLIPLQLPGSDALPFFFFFSKVGAEAQHLAGHPGYRCGCHNEHGGHHQQHW